MEKKLVASRKSINNWTLINMILRSFFLQACWNFKRMQNVGFCFSICPVIKKLWDDPLKRKEVVKRHLDFFNSHPYCVSIILGVIARLEEEATQHEEVDIGQINKIKTGMMGPLAALGDTVYWGMFRPAVALLGVSLIILANPQQWWQAGLGLILFLAIYSLGHLGLRIGGVFIGYAKGIEVIKDLRRFNPQFIAHKISFFIAIVLGVVIAAYAVHKDTLILDSNISKLVIFSIMVGVFYLGLRVKLSSTILFYLLLVVTILFKYLGIV